DTTAMRSRLRSFNHGHKQYNTVFGALHVRYAACLIGFVYLLALCMLLAICLIYSQSSYRPKDYGPKINLKLLTIPIGLVFITIFYLFIGIIQQKSNLLYPFILLQVFLSFLIAILLMIVVICSACDARKVLHRYLLFGRDTKHYEQDRLPIAIIISVLSCLLVFQMWATRAVCGCFRYFTYHAKHAARMANYV
ncbi:hypothetical protein PMAYCL1PPCAC_03469, partial [Pristionchus mayeri]